MPEPGPDDAEQPVPLARLFAMAMRYLVDELHARLADRGWPDMRPAFGFTLLAARQQPLTSGAIATLLGMTKQAASKLVDAMEDVGYVRRQPNADDARAKLVELTPKGHHLLAEVEHIYVELEAEWAAIVGRKPIEALRGDLQTVLREVHDGELPAIRPTW